MKRLTLFVWAFAAWCLLILVLGSPLWAAWQDGRLDAVASRFANRPVHVDCYADEDLESPQSYGAWGYVLMPTAKQTAANLDELLCKGALNINDPLVPAWQRAMGALVLVHESTHLRRWGGAGSEAKTECRSIRHWKAGARMLGATPETVAELWPAALAAHYEEAEIIDPWSGTRPYYDPDCSIPPLIEEAAEVEARRPHSF